jgi:hypothetical protein
MKKTISLFFLVIAIASVNAQTINTTALQTYPASVVLRVYNVATKATLSTAEQTTLADLFQDEETELAALALNGAAPSVIDSVKNAYQAEFNTLLSSTQFAAYSQAVNSAKVNTTARLMATMLRNKYTVDATMQQYFTSIINWRETAIEKIWLRDTDSTTRNNNLAYTFYIYDSLLSVYTNAAASGNYFASRVYYLDSISQIDSTKKLALATTYYNNCIQFKYRAYADNFNVALKTVFNTVADTPYYAALYKSDILKTSTNLAAATLSSYSKQYQLSTLALHQLAPIVLQQQRVVSLINKILPNYTAAKDSIIDTLTYSFQKQIDDIIIKDGNIFNPTQLDIAIKNAFELGLNQEQQNLVSIKLVALNALRNDFKNINPSADYDSKAFESQALNELLTPEQYTKVLTTKFLATATNMAIKDWNELIRLDLSSTYDSATTKTELTNYHLAILIAYYRNANNTELQYISIHSINEIMPDAMRILLQQWNFHTPYSDTPDTFFQW